MGRLGGRGADGMGWGMGKGEWGGGGWGGIGSETLSITMEMKYIFVILPRNGCPFIWESIVFQNATSDLRKRTGDTFLSFCQKRVDRSLEKQTFPERDFDFSFSYNFIVTN